MIMQQIPISATAAPYMGYLLSLPDGYNDPINATKQWPLVISLHGAGEFGNGLANDPNGLPKVATQGPFLELSRGNGGMFSGAIVVAPQATNSTSPTSQAWFWYQTGKKMALAMQALYRVNSKRIYLMGYSAGGKNTWDGADWEPTRFAAIVPMCGLYTQTAGCPVLDAALLARKQVWAFHAFDDAANSINHTVRWINGITPSLCGGLVGNVLLNYPGAATGKVWTGSYQPPTNTWNWWEGIVPSLEGGPKITIYPNGGHGGGWVPTYHSPQMWSWLFNQALP